MTSNRKIKPKEFPTNENIREFLSMNPDFFSKNPDLLNSLEIIHDSGTAVSLIQKQVELLRTNFKATNDQLNNLLNIAKKNENLLKITKQLILEIIPAKEISEIVNIVETMFVSKFGASQCKILFFSEKNELNLPKERLKNKIFAKRIEDLLKQQNNYFGSLSKEDLEYIFENKTGMNEVSLIKLNCISVSGILIFGSNMTDKYNPDKGTLFLDFITDILSKTIDIKNT